MDVIKSLKEHPVRYAHMMGFDRLNHTHDEWLRRILFGSGDWTLQAFRGSYKTTTVSVALAMMLFMMPNRRTAFMRKTDADIKEVVSQVKRMIELPETKALSAMIWGHQVELVRANQTELSTNLTNDPRGSSQLTGMGISGSLTGKHYDIIFTDDIVNLKDRISRAEREHTKSVYMELQNIRNRGGRIINTGTPWHVDDCFSIMPEAEKWDYTTIPEVFSKEDAEKIRPTMTPSLWAANYELRHIPSDDVIFTNPQKGAPIEMVEQGECQTDAAYYGEDFTAFSALNVHGGKVYVYGRMWRKHIEDVEAEIVEECNRLKLGRMYMETNADKGYAAKALREKGLRVATYPEKMNKYVKIVTYLKTTWPDVVFCEGTDEAYINQICDFTEDAEHDDAPDSLASLVMHSKIMKAWGGEYRSPYEPQKIYKM